MMGFNEDSNMNGRNHTVYGVTKNAADLLCQEWSKAFDIPIIVNRLSCIYGPHQFGKVGQGWVVWFVIAKYLNLPLYFYGYKGKQVRDCLYIQDLCNLIEKQTLNIEKFSGSYYNVGGGMKHSASIREVSDKINDLMKLDHRVEEIAEPRKADQKLYISDITKVSNDFNWSPEVTINEGLIKVIDWVKNTDLSWVKFN